jgi:hypothetical protein
MFLKVWSEELLLKLYQNKDPDVGPHSRLDEAFKV